MTRLSGVILSENWRLTAQLSGGTPAEARTWLAPHRNPFALKLLASRAQRVGGLRAKAGT